jgi:hypothetical protein
MCNIFNLFDTAIHYVISVILHYYLINGRTGVVLLLPSSDIGFVESRLARISQRIAIINVSRWESHSHLLRVLLMTWFVLRAAPGPNKRQAKARRRQAEFMPRENPQKERGIHQTDWLWTPSVSGFRSFALRCHATMVFRIPPTDSWFWLNACWVLPDDKVISLNFALFFARVPYYINRPAYTLKVIRYAKEDNCKTWQRR